MPKAELPTNTKGWIAALISSFIGFVAGFAVLRILNDLWK